MGQGRWPESLSISPTHPRSGHHPGSRARADSPAPGPRREPAQLAVVALIRQGHLGSDEQDLPTDRGTRPLPR